MTGSNQYRHYLLYRVLPQTVLVVAIVYLGFLVTSRMLVRWDLTEDKRFTISESSHRMARALEDPLTIRAYFSEKLPERYMPLAQQVFDILKEYEAASGGKIKVERFDPDESAAAKGEAENYGIKPAQLGVIGATEQRIVNAYGGIVMLYRDKASEVIDIASSYPQGYEGLSVLEYDISSRLWQLSHERPKLGLAGYLAKEAGGEPWQPQRGGPQPEFDGLRRLLGEAFDIENVDLKTKDLDPHEVPLLMLVRPKEMTEVEVFRLDQYVMKGGRVLMFVTEGTIEAGWGESGWTYKPFKTGLDEWLRFQGIGIPNEFVLHYVRANPIEIPAEILPGIQGYRQIANWFWPVIVEEGSLDTQNPAVQSLKQISLFWAHPVDIFEDRVGPDKRATVLVRSHAAESWRWKDLNQVDMRRVKAQQEGPTSFSSSPLVVALEGRFHSYYADHPAPSSLGGGETPEKPKEEGEGPKDDDKTDEKEDEKKDETPAGPTVVKETVDPTQVVIVGNSIFISDAVLGGQGANDNAKQATLLAFNLVDWLARSKDLIALRAKKYTKRSVQETDTKDAVDALVKRGEKGEIDEATFRAELEKLGDALKAKRKTYRWSNVIAPSLLILLAGAIVWVLRAGGRARPARIPSAVAPSGHDEVDA